MASFFFFARGSSFTLDQWVAFFSRDLARCSHSVKRFCMTPWANQLVQKDKTKVSGLDFAFQCSLCEYSCDTDQKLSLHNFSKHRVLDPIRCYVNTTFCTVCLVEFHQRENVLNHIRRGRTPCKRQLLLAGPLISADEADAIDLSLRSHNCCLQKKGLRRHSLVAPCVRLQGPKVAFALGPVRG